MLYFNISRNKYKNYVLQNLSPEHIILKLYYKMVKCIFFQDRKSSSFKKKELNKSYIKQVIKIITIIVFQFTQRAIENRSACRRLP
jgi:hypothetical protein